MPVRSPPTRYSANVQSTNHPNSHLTDCGADSSIDFGDEGIDVSPIPGSYLEQVLGLQVRNQLPLHACLSRRIHI